MTSESKKYFQRTYINVYGKENKLKDISETDYKKLSLFEKAYSSCCSIINKLKKMEGDLKSISKYLKKKSIKEYKKNIKEKSKIKKGDPKTGFSMKYNITNEIKEKINKISSGFNSNTISSLQITEICLKVDKESKSCKINDSIFDDLFSEYLKEFDNLDKKYLPSQKTQTLINDDMYNLTRQQLISFTSAFLKWINSNN